MTRIDFYILQDVDLGALRRFACRLAAKAVGSGHRAYVHTTDATAAAEMDELLWCYPDNRMIPHGLVGQRDAIGAPVVIGHDDATDWDGLLINLAREIPVFFGRFDRVAEIVVDETKSMGRDHYKFYRDRGYPLFHHDLDEWET